MGQGVWREGVWNVPHTLRIGALIVTPKCGCDKCTYLCRSPIGRMKRSYLTGLPVHQRSVRRCSEHDPITGKERGRLAREILADKRRLGNHALPALLLRLLARVDDLEHLLLGDAADLREGHGEAGGLLGALVLDGGADCLGRGGVLAVEQVGGHGVGRVVLGGGALDVALLVGLDLLAHLDLLLVPLLGVHLGPQAAQVLGFL